MKSKVTEIYGQCKSCLDGFTVEVVSIHRNGHREYRAMETPHFNRRPDGSFYHNRPLCKNNVVALYGKLPALSND